MSYHKGDILICTKKCSKYKRFIQIVDVVRLHTIPFEYRWRYVKHHRQQPFFYTTTNVEELERDYKYYGLNYNLIWKKVTLHENF